MCSLASEMGSVISEQWRDAFFVQAALIIKYFSEHSFYHAASWEENSSCHFCISPWIPLQSVQCRKKSIQQELETWGYFNMNLLGSCLWCIQVAADVSFSVLHKFGWWIYLIVLLKAFIHKMPDLLFIWKY